MLHVKRYFRSKRDAVAGLHRPGTFERRDAQAGRSRRPRFAGVALPVALALVLAGGVLWSVGCSNGSDDSGKSSSATTSKPSGDVQGQVGKPLAIGDVRITVNALEATLNPSFPSQRMSDQTPVPPGAADSFYQAFVRVENRGAMPVRVDGLDFYCLVGDSSYPVDATRSGPQARSLLPGTSLDVVLTFRAPAGFEPVLVYRPPWYSGLIRISRPAETTTSSS